MGRNQTGSSRVRCGPFHFISIILELPVFEIRNTPAKGSYALVSSVVALYQPLATMIGLVERFAATSAIRQTLPFPLFGLLLFHLLRPGNRWLVILLIPRHII